MEIEAILIDGQNVSMPNLREFLAERTSSVGMIHVAGSESSAVTPKYGIRDSRAVTLTGTPVGRGACTFADARTYTGAGIAEHIHSYQVAQGGLSMSGLVDNYRSFYSVPGINGPGVVTNVKIFDAENPTGAGTITNLYGIYIAAMTRGSTNNFAVYADGTATSQFGGVVRSLTGVNATRAGDDDPSEGPYFQVSNVAGNRLWNMQLNALDTLDFHNFNGTSWLVTANINRTGIRLPHTSAPASPINGDMWTTTAGLFVRINGVSVGPLS